jgi:hypothetical protein
MSVKLCLQVGLFLVLFSVATMASGNDSSQAVDPAQVQGLQERMLNDPGIMALILSLQNDPEMQALLSDPAVVAAVQSGNLSALTSNPKVQSLLGKQQVKEIENKIRSNRAD